MDILAETAASGERIWWSRSASPTPALARSEARLAGEALIGSKRAGRPIHWWHVHVQITCTRCPPARRAGRSSTSRLRRSARLIATRTGFGKLSVAPSIGGRSIPHRRSVQAHLVWRQPARAVLAALCRLRGRGPRRVRDGQPSPGRPRHRRDWHRCTGLAGLYDKVRLRSFGGYAALAAGDHANAAEHLAASLEGLGPSGVPSNAASCSPISPPPAVTTATRRPTTSTRL
jgi:hypothetical protein